MKACLLLKNNLMSRMGADIELARTVHLHRM